jgi:diamine N-acetyltransferase
MSTTTSISLRPITKDNWEEAANLEILPEQAGFLTPNVYSIAESKFHDDLWTFAIYNGETMVGFAMYGQDPADGRYWIIRFMIDRNHQRRGYGRAAFQKLIEYMRTIPGITAINIGYNRENIVAANLYRSFGFVESGIAPWGEQTAVLDLAR